MRVEMHKAHRTGRHPAPQGKGSTLALPAVAAVAPLRGLWDGAHLATRAAPTMQARAVAPPPAVITPVVISSRLQANEAVSTVQSSFQVSWIPDEALGPGRVGTGVIGCIEHFPF
jgi:hypothetical protein